MSTMEVELPFWKVGASPLLHTYRPSAVSHVERISPLLSLRAGPQLVCFALKSPAIIISQTPPRMLLSRSDRNVSNSVILILGDI